ncbi:triphosphoribosyl-dephospho-CoA synthase [Streptomyces sp. NPDC051940]|uniref:triphosphoribosyl-dephospho-CoA synthase n=1 Tax=Streptomyces sp. NPDC051940 TaxID=3155675 RepID=UPI0034162E9B
MGYVVRSAPVRPGLAVRPTGRSDAALAAAAVDALVAVLELAPKPGLPDDGDPRLGALRWSARALRPGFAAMAASARRTGAAGPALRAELGSIGRATERSARAAAASAAPAPHHGAVWLLGSLVAAAALHPAAPADGLPALAGRLATLPDARAPRRPSPGQTASARYGAAGARGEARAGFPHVRAALRTLREARRRGAREPAARVTALLTVTSTLPDTGLLHHAGPHGLRTAQSGARSALAASTPQAWRSYDEDLRSSGLTPWGSAYVLAGALFLDGRPSRSG